MLKDIHHQLSAFLQNWSPKISQNFHIIKREFIFKLVYPQEFLLDLSGWGVKI